MAGTPPNTITLGMKTQHEFWRRKAIFKPQYMVTADAM
jgi:hypothetical protein